jgi:hypothetical protein
VRDEWITTLILITPPLAQTDAIATGHKQMILIRDLVLDAYLLGLFLCAFEPLLDIG